MDFGSYGYPTAMNYYFRDQNGKLYTTGGKQIFEYTDFEYTVPGTYTIDLTTISGTPDRLSLIHI